eukprot:356902-Chlamydomonas_euryale.AAC.10
MSRSWTTPNLSRGFKMAQTSHKIKSARVGAWSTRNACKWAVEWTAPAKAAGNDAAHGHKKKAKLKEIPIPEIKFVSDDSEIEGDLPCMPNSASI